MRNRHPLIRVKSVAAIAVALAINTVLAPGAGSQDIAPPRFRALAAGDQFTCGVALDGRAYCWGANYLAQLGTEEAASTCSDSDVDAAPCSRFPVPVAMDMKFVAISAGNSHACAIGVDGGVWCWGDARDGALGVQPVPDLCRVHGPIFGREALVQCAHSPLRVPVPGRFVAITSGAEASCAVDDRGTAWCWGGQPESDGPVRIPLDAPLTTVSMAGERACGLTAPQGMVRCWRWPRDRDDGFETPTGEREWIALAVARAHACAIATDSTVQCWGNDADAALGRGRVARRHGTESAPATVALRGTFRAIAVATSRSCAVTGDDRLFCWGRLGRRAADDECPDWNDMPGSKSCTSTPRPVAAGQRVGGVTLARTHSCDWLVSGESACWGANDWGELGDGTRLASAGLSTVIGVDRSASPTVWVREKVPDPGTIVLLALASAVCAGVVAAIRWRRRARALDPNPTGWLPLVLVLSGSGLLVAAFVATRRAPHDEVSAGIAAFMLLVAAAVSCLLALVGGGIAMARLRRLPNARHAAATVTLAALDLFSAGAMLLIQFFA